MKPFSIPLLISMCLGPPSPKTAKKLLLFLFSSSLLAFLLRHRQRPISKKEGRATARHKGTTVATTIRFPGDDRELSADEAAEEETVGRDEVMAIEGCVVVDELIEVVSLGAERLGETVLVGDGAAAVSSNELDDSEGVAEIRALLDELVPEANSDG